MRREKRTSSWAGGERPWISHEDSDSQAGNRLRPPGRTPHTKAAERGAAEKYTKSVIQKSVIQKFMLREEQEEEGV